MSNNQITGWNYMFFALLAFVAFPLDWLSLFLIKLICININISEMTQQIFEHILTSSIWGLFVYYILKKSQINCSFKLLLNSKTNKIKSWQWLLVCLCIVTHMIISWINWNGSKVLLEYKYNGLIGIIFQYIYYIVEVLLFLIMIIFVQKACEIWFKKSTIPYGGIIVGATWGVIAYLYTKFVCRSLRSCYGLGLWFNLFIT